MDMDVEFLSTALSEDAQVQAMIPDSLKEFLENTNLTRFLDHISQEVQNEPKANAASSKLVGILLKNHSDVTTSWVSVDSSTRGQIKMMLLNMLSSSNSEARHTAAQVIAKIASIDIPRNDWPDLMKSLLGNMDNETSIKKATLESLGYICEVIRCDDIHQQDVDRVLEAVVASMHLSQETAVRIAAITALHNALNFGQTHFERVNERDNIMSAICETARDKEPKIRKMAFQCLVSVASTYYEFLEPYISNIFRLTSDAFEEAYKLGEAGKLDEAEKLVVVQVFEVWNSISDEEFEIQRDSRRRHLRLIEKVMDVLVQMLLATLLKHDLEDSPSSLSVAAGTCLSHVARTVGDAIVDKVLSFVQPQLLNPTYKARGAATYAFGSILEGPNAKTLSHRVRLELQMLLHVMKEQRIHVEDILWSHLKDTIMWTLSRIFELLHNHATGFSVISSTNIKKIIPVLLESTKDSANIAGKGCRAIYYVAQGYEGFVGGSSPLTPYLVGIIKSLIVTAERTDTRDLYLQFAAYETLKEVVRCSNLSEESASQTITGFLNTVISKLEETCKPPNKNRGKQKQGDLQELLCGVLHEIIQKLNNREDTKLSMLKAADMLMDLFPQVVASRVQKEVMLEIVGLAYASGSEFESHMPKFWKCLVLGLEDYTNYELCSTCLGVVRGMCRWLYGKMILPYCDNLMEMLLGLVSADRLYTYVKPAIFSCFGDVACVIGEPFFKYVSPTMDAMQKAVYACGIDDMEYSNQLTISILEACTPILEKLKNPKDKLISPDV